MALQKLQFRAGLNTQVSSAGNEGGWSGGNLVRFRDGLAQKWAGWVRAIDTLLTGIARAAFAWQQLDSAYNTAFGTHAKLELLQGGVLHDITPAGLAAGSIDTIPSAGVGVGPVGTGTVGSPRTGGTLGCRLWSLINFGEILLASPRDGGLYAWAPSGGTGTHAAIVTNGGDATIGPPLRIGKMLMGMPERHVVLLGSSALNLTTSYDPMLVRFSDLEDYTVWKATAENSAGSFRLEGGTKLIGGLSVAGQILIWSDLCLFSMRFLGNQLVYGFTTIGSNCGLIGPNAAAEYGGVVYWMNRTGFFRFIGGRPEPLACDIYRTVFGNISDAQGDKTWAGVNTATDEVLWFYQSETGTDVDRYAAFCTTSGEWTFGVLARTTFIDTSNYMPPIGTDPAGVIYSHEIGTDDVALPMLAFIMSGDFDVGDGTQFMVVDLVIPDFVEQAGNVYMTVYARNEPNGPQKAYGPFVLTTTTTKKSLKVRGRQIAFRFETREAGAHFRLSNALRINAYPDGTNG